MMEVWYIIRRTHPPDLELERERLPYPAVVLERNPYVEKHSVHVNVSAGYWLAATTDEEEAYALAEMLAFSEGLPWVDNT